MPLLWSISDFVALKLIGEKVDVSLDSTLWNFKSDPHV